MTMQEKTLSFEQMLLIVTRTMASVVSMSVGFGFSTNANFPFSMYVYASIIIFYIINIIRPSALTNISGKRQITA